MIQEKKCKGTGKAKGHGCGIMVSIKERKYGLGRSCGCWSKWLTTTEEGQAMIAMTTLQVTKPRRSLEETRAESSRSNKLSYLLMNTRIACHNYIRARDKGLPCISCGKKWHSDFQAGHFFKAELYSSVKYHEDNIHGQCPWCNVYKEGNLNGYAIGLKEKIGNDNFLELEKNAIEESRDFKWNREDLERIRTHYINKLKELKS